MATTAKAIRPLDTSRWLTRRQAGDLLGVSEGTLSRWERMGLLHPQYERRGESVRAVTIYDPDELARVPRKHMKAIPSAPGEQAARAFELFREGKTIEEAVIDLREVPARVNEIYDQWLDATAATFVISPAARTELAAALGDFRSVAELCARVRERLEHLAPPIVTTVPDSMTDAQIEIVIQDALDCAGAPK